MIVGNEHADIMEVLFLDMFGQHVQENSRSQNVFLAPSLNERAEYQTVHGSADNLHRQENCKSVSYPKSDGSDLGTLCRLRKDKGRHE